MNFGQLFYSYVFRYFLTYLYKFHLLFICSITPIPLSICIPLHLEISYHIWPEYLVNDSICIYSATFLNVSYNFLYMIALNICWIIYFGQWFYLYVFRYFLTCLFKFPLLFICWTTNLGKLFFSYLPLLLKCVISFVAVFQKKYWSYIWSMLLFIHIPLLILISSKFDQIIWSMILFIYVPLLFEILRIILQFVVEFVTFFHRWYKLIPLLFAICCNFFAKCLVNLSFRFIYLAPFL